jgi:outer membrane protein
MKKSPLLLATALLAIAAGAQAAPAAAPAPAAAAPAAAAPAAPTFGAPIAGQCVLDEQEAMADSALGKAAIARLGQLKSVVDSELQTTSTSLETEGRQLASTQPTAATPAATKAAWDAKAQAWGKKRDAFQAKVQQRQQEMQLTQQSVMSYIFQKMIPSINAVVTQRSCATVVSAESLLHYDSTATNNGQETQTSFTYVNPAMDITNAVVQKMDASGETLPPFERANLDQQQGAPAGAAAPAATKPAAPKK